MSHSDSNEMKVTVQLVYLKDIQSNLVNPTLFVSDSFPPDCKVSGLSNQLFMTGNYYGYVVKINVMNKPYHV